MKYSMTDAESVNVRRYESIERIQGLPVVAALAMNSILMCWRAVLPVECAQDSEVVSRPISSRINVDLDVEADI